MSSASVTSASGPHSIAFAFLLLPGRLCSAIPRKSHFLTSFRSLLGGHRPSCCSHSSFPPLFAPCLLHYLKYYILLFIYLFLPFCGRHLSKLAPKIPPTGIHTPVRFPPWVGGTSHCRGMDGHSQD